MPYYNKDVVNKLPELVSYFKTGIVEDSKNIGHCILFWGADITLQCELALEIARLLNCKEGGHVDCDCLNCRWIREQTHPSVKIYTRLDFKETSDKSDGDDGSASIGKKNISVAQAKGIIYELAVSSDYHRVYIFCDRDDDGNLLPLNQINFPEISSNALLKTFEEPPKNTTFIFLTQDKTDVISTVVSRAQSFFVPAQNYDDIDYSLVEGVISDYWEIDKQQVLDFENSILNLAEDNGIKIVLTQIENYMREVLKSNYNNKKLFYRIMRDLKYVEEAKRQSLLTPPMHPQIVCENLAFKMILS